MVTESLNLKKDKKISRFQASVYKILKKVPKGKVTTYGAIARKLKNSPRAVGNALNKNPYGYSMCDFHQGVGRNHRSVIRGDSKKSGFFLVPCHRVINSNGNLGGFASGTKNKIKLLKKEGIKIEKGKIDLERYGFKF